jgi:undecaprenyl-diphosphatase
VFDDDIGVERAAELLAADAILFLGLGLAALVAASAAIVFAVRLLVRVQPVVQPAFAALVRRVERAGWLDSRVRAFIPSSYLALHLAIGLIVTAAAAGFLVLAEEVSAGEELARFDVAFAAALRRSTSDQWEQFFTWVSWFGSREVLTAVTVVAAAALFLARRPVLAAGWLIAQAGGGVLNLALKAAYARTRPEFADPMLAASSGSFPSGHAMGTFVLVGFGAYILARRVRSWTAALAIATAALAWCLLMAFSRLYLGQHFASDVVAGLVAGSAWVAVCISAYHRGAGR